MAEDYLKKLVRDGVISADQLTEAIDLSSSLGTTVDDFRPRSTATSTSISKRWRFPKASCP